MFAELLLILIGAAEASTRTVCYELVIRDNRFFCPTTGTGTRRACQALTLSSGDKATYAVGFRVELWDKDSSGPDDFIGAWRPGGTGERCHTFEWSGIGEVETNPDVYVVLEPSVRKPSLDTPIVYATDSNGDRFADFSWRDGTASDPDAFVAVDCANGASCRIAPSAYLVPTSNMTTLNSQALMAIDTAERTLEAFGSSINDTSAVDMWIVSQTSCPNGSPGCANSRTKVQFDLTVTNSGATPAHELGHVLMMREYYDDYLDGDCSLNGPSHSTGVAEHDSCATTEGWADYAAVVTWWDPAVATAPKFKNVSIEPVATCVSSTETSEDEVARVLWDLDDANNEGAEAGNATTDWILDMWDQFPNGIFNRMDHELGADGPNMWDYEDNGIFGAEYLNAFTSNCMDAQTL